MSSISINHLVESYIDKTYGCIGGFPQFNKKIDTAHSFPILKTLSGEVFSKESFFYSSSILLARPSAYNRTVFSTSKTLSNRLEVSFTPQYDRETLEGECIYNVHQDVSQKMTNPLTLSNYYTVTSYVERIVLIRKVLLKEMRGENDIHEIWDFKGGRVWFFSLKRLFDDPRLPPPIGFPTLYCQLGITESVPMKFVAELTLRGNPDCASDAFWVQNYVEHIFPKFLKWASSEPKMHADPGPTISLEVICHDTYQEMYKTMKNKYMTKVFEIWGNANEKTDPSKFVPEDIAIASYVRVLQQTKGFNFGKKFVDLGCGNGLLTYLLVSEGWEGIGLDIRRRRIWDFFPNMDKSLMAADLMATSFKIHDYADSKTLLIGNHPDQLTPWIPVLGRAKHCPFVIIPCCAYDWSGKYERFKGSDMEELGSIYRNYMHSSIELAKKCGYECTVDRLRIPSTKKLAIIGIPKCMDGLREDARRIRVQVEIARSQKPGTASRSTKVVENAMAIRNCTSLPKEEIDDVIMKILFLLLDTALESDVYFKHENGITWNRGNQTTSLNDLVKNLGPERLKLLKAQNKGLQTLLRNHKYIFNLEDGAVRLRIPMAAEKARILNSNPSVFKKKVCFFDKYHPGHCPLPLEQCSFRHRNEPVDKHCDF